MAGKQKKIHFQRDVFHFKDFEDHVKFSKEQNGLLVIDLYTTWAGPCKAVVSSFRRMYIEYDCVERPIRFLRVDGDKVLESLEKTEEEEEKGERTYEELEERKKYTDLLRIHESHSKPTFVLYYKGNVLKTINGVNMVELRKSFDGVIKEMGEIDQENEERERNDEEEEEEEEEEEVEAPKPQATSQAAPQKEKAPETPANTL
eukprot:TRINITY_DN276_c0_g2_i1.p2 TRINITY_DN276_c0_g2~~TRINITY_DN276_c0_g2_i1.p2  ORF type:complete len:237 (-),score=77.02 TRINITY_DN276_c0_g2_i1:758-1366(-)